MKYGFVVCALGLIASQAMAAEKCGRLKPNDTFIEMNAIIDCLESKAETSQTSKTTSLGQGEIDAGRFTVKIAGASKNRANRLTLYSKLSIRNKSSEPLRVALDYAASPSATDETAALARFGRVEGLSVVSTNNDHKPESFTTILGGQSLAVSLELSFNSESEGKNLEFTIPLVIFNKEKAERFTLSPIYTLK